MKNETKYTLNDILNVVQKLPDSEKDFMLKKVSVADILRIYNNKNEYCTLTKTIDEGMEEWKLWKSSIEGLYKELNKYDSDTVYKYANIKVTPEIDGYTFARMVNVVAKVTQRDIKHCCASIWAIINRLYILKEYPTDDFSQNETQNDVEKSKYLLEKYEIDFNKKVFWILSDIHAKWNDYSEVEKEAIAKAVVDVYNMEIFLVLIENWDKIDDPVPSSDIKAIISEIELNDNNKFFGLKDSMIWLDNKIIESETRENSTGLVQAMKDLDRKMCERDSQFLCKASDITGDNNG